MEWSEEEEEGRKERKREEFARVEVFILARTSQRQARRGVCAWRGILDRHGGEAEVEVGSFFHFLVTTVAGPLVFFFVALCLLLS